MNTMYRKFFNVGDIEIEICVNSNTMYFVSHNVFWYIAYEKKNPDPKLNCVIDNLNILANNRVKTIKWAGYEFKFEQIIFVEDDMSVEAVLIPLKMFEDFIKFQSKNYRGTPPENSCTKLGKWLESNSLKDLLTSST